MIKSQINGRVIGSGMRITNETRKFYFFIMRIRKKNEMSRIKSTLQVQLCKRPEHPIQFQLSRMRPSLSCLCGFFLLNRQSFWHNLFKVLILTTTLWLWAKRKIMSLLLKSIVKHIFNSLSIHGILLRQAYVLADVVSEGRLYSQHFDFFFKCILKMKKKIFLLPFFFSPPWP